jgi:hypothetical protein
MVPPSQTQRELRQAKVLHLARKLARNPRLGGLVPVGLIRDELSAELDAADVDATLLEMDRLFLLDLKVPNDPVEARRLGAIEVPDAANPGRVRLLAFVVLR